MEICGNFLNKLDTYLEYFEKIQKILVQNLTPRMSKCH